jgi:hypothetical protein
VGAPTPNLPPSIFWPTPPGLAAGAHVWVIGGSLTPSGVFELVAADHVVPLTRHAIGVQRSPLSGPPGTSPQIVERLAPAARLTLGRQYQLRVRAAGRTDIVGVWTVGEPAPRPEVTRCSLHLRDGELFVDIAIRGTAIVQVLADSGGAALEIVTGEAVLEAPRHDASTRQVEVRVLADDGTRIDERVLSIA